MYTDTIDQILNGLYDHSIVPYLGPGVLYDAVNQSTGEPMPADSNSLILAMNDGVPMAPKLMYEFPRAAMNKELKKGRNFLTQFFTKTYMNTEWTRATLHDWLAEWEPRYTIDINRDTQLQQSYAKEEHLLICGVARITATQFRYRLYYYDGENYFEMPEEQINPKLPILFKPMGTPLPDANYIASDADYVDYITELMGGFAIPNFVKENRKDKQYLLLGMPLNRDSERMVLSDITYDAKTEKRGWVLNKAPTAKELRYCKKIGLEIIDMDIPEFLDCVGFNKPVMA